MILFYAHTNHGVCSLGPDLRPKPVRRRFHMLETFWGAALCSLPLGEVKPSRLILGEPGGRKVAWLLIL